jgi:hypothetical protein
VSHNDLQNEEDRATIYTAEPDTNSTVRDSYTSELAKLLYDALDENQADVEITNNVYGRLEELLRSFALRLVHTSPTHEVTRLARFIHRYRRQVALSCDVAESYQPM